MSPSTRAALLVCALLACGDDADTQPGDASGSPDGEARDAPASGGEAEYGEVFRGGQFHLGPVDFDETAFHNACASEQKYLPAVRATAGALLAGVWNGLPNHVALCDSCVRVDTALGKSAVLRVVTYGDTSPNSLDVSPEAFALLDSGEYPRTMTWQSVRCPESGAIQYEFRAGSHAYWTAFWVRNARAPIAKVETQSVNHPLSEIAQESNGAFVDYGGFGDGAFTIRVTSVDGQVVEDNFTGPPAGFSGLADSKGNFE